jgi:protein-disulfide isomerase
VSVLPTIEEEFISTGQAKLQARTIAVLGGESSLSAQAAECANDQGRFWEFYDTLYLNQNGENEGAFSKDNLKRFAAALNLDTVAFDSCLDSGKYSSKVTDETAAARQMGVNQVPTIFVNGKQVLQATDTGSMRAAIQDALSSAP